MCVCVCMHIWFLESFVFVFLKRSMALRLIFCLFLLPSDNCGLPWWLRCKESACSAGDPGSIPGLGKCPGGGHGNPLQYCCLENPMIRGAWQAIVHWGHKRIRHNWVRTHTHTHTAWENSRREPEGILWEADEAGVQYIMNSSFLTSKTVRIVATEREAGECT